MPFNLKRYLEAQNKDPQITEKQLREENSIDGEPETITEDQLTNRRTDKDSETTTEAQLDKVRKAAATDTETLVEGLLDSSKSKIVKHRNEEAYTGNINKVEEQRLANKKRQETEKYKNVSETDKAFRFLDTPGWQRWPQIGTKKNTIAQLEDFDLVDVDDITNPFEERIRQREMNERLREMEDSTLLDVGEKDFGKGHKKLLEDSGLGGNYFDDVDRDKSGLGQSKKDFEKEVEFDPAEAEEIRQLFVESPVNRDVMWQGSTQIPMEVRKLRFQTFIFSNERNQISGKEKREILSYAVKYVQLMHPEMHIERDGFEFGKIDTTKGYGELVYQVPVEATVEELPPDKEPTIV